MQFEGHMLYWQTDGRIDFCIAAGWFIIYNIIGNLHLDTLIQLIK